MSDAGKPGNDRFRSRLEQMLDELLKLRDSSSQDRAAVQLDQQSVGRLSRMDAIQVQQMALAADRQRRVQISRIQRALKQIDDGEFGFCLECGNEIPEGRLQADPAAHLCIGCAAARAG
jgi:DnaK suppressor protein